MAYDYDVDILAAYWTGAEDGEEPYASFIAANPTLTDEVSENRILSTIELIRSHMELLQTREEAKLLHESISKLFRHTAGGSNPWSEAAAVTDAVGNVPGPVFPAGASIDITIDGVTSSPVSASGGDCATVAAELNATLDASIPGDFEQTTVDTTGATSVGLSGTSFNINSANDATPYYVWFDFPGLAEATSITAVADVAGSLGETYFDMNSPEPADFYVWISHDGLAEAVSLDFTAITGATLPTGAVAAAYFDIDSTTAAYRCWFSDGSTIAPAAGGRSLLTVPFAGGDADTVVAGSVVFTLAVLSGDADFAGLGGILPAITGTLASAGDVADPVDGAEATGAIFSSTTQGIDAAETDPAAEGTGIEAPIAVNDTAGDVGIAVRDAIDANGDWGAEGGNPFTVTSAFVGDVADTADGAAATGFGFAPTQQGVDASIDPATGGRTGITVAVAAGLADSEIGSVLRAAVGGNADFATEGAGNSSELNAIVNGVTTDSADVDSGLGISTTNQGVDDIGDAVAVQAFCVLPGPRLGFRGQEDFVTFDLANGSGGVVGPAGIIPGERKSSVKKVADDGRDLSLNHFAGTRRDPDLTS